VSDRDAGYHTVTSCTKKLKLMKKYGQFNYNLTPLMCSSCGCKSHLLGFELETSRCNTILI
jgi:hypothetical protein